MGKWVFCGRGVWSSCRNCKSLIIVQCFSMGNSLFCRISRGNTCSTNRHVASTCNTYPDHQSSSSCWLASFYGKRPFGKSAILAALPFAFKWEKLLNAWLPLLSNVANLSSPKNSMMNEKRCGVFPWPLLFPAYRPPAVRSHMSHRCMWHCSRQGESHDMIFLIYSHINHS